MIFNLKADTSDLVQLITSTVADLDVIVSFVDSDETITSSSNMIPDRQLTKINTAATTTILGTPGTNLTRNAKYIDIRNVHASTANDVTVLVDVAGTEYLVKKCTLLPGESLTCAEGVWFHFDANGGVYGATVALADTRVTTARLASAHSVSSATGTEVTGLKVNNVAPGTYIFTYFCIVRSSTAGTGVGLGVNFTGTAAVRKMRSQINDTGGLSTGTGSADDAVTNPGNMMSGCTTTAFSTTSPNLMTSDVATTATDIFITVEGIMIVTAIGNLEFWHSSETAVATTVEAGSSLVLIKTA